jgi:hypothetical protein
MLRFVSEGSISPQETPIIERGIIAQFGDNSALGAMTSAFVACRVDYDDEP